MIFVNFNPKIIFHKMDPIHELKNMPLHSSIKKDKDLNKGFYYYYYYFGIS